MKLMEEAVQKGKEEPKVNDLDVWALVVRVGLKNSPDNRQAHYRLIQYAREHCGEAMVHYFWKKRAQLPAMIDDFWIWENIKDCAST